MGPTHGANKKRKKKRHKRGNKQKERKPAPKRGRGRTSIADGNSFGSGGKADGPGCSRALVGEPDAGNQLPTDPWGLDFISNYGSRGSCGETCGSFETLHRFSRWPDCGGTLTAWAGRTHPWKRTAHAGGLARPGGCWPNRQRHARTYVLGCSSPAPSHKHVRRCKSRGPIASRRGRSGTCGAEWIRRNWSWNCSNPTQSSNQGSCPIRAQARQAQSINIGLC